MAGWWENYPWRIIQTNFREIDTLDFDPEEYIRQLKSFHCNALMLNAAGLLASYPTGLADHTPSPFIQDFDLKGLVERCHREGIRVIARTDFSRISLAVYERHPDWAYRLPDGSPLIYNDTVQACLLGGYQGSYMDQILEELLTKIPFDGLYCNMGGATGYVVDYSMKRYGPCQCEKCRDAFQTRYGMEIPRELTRTDKASLLYFRFQQELAGAQKKRVTALLRRINPQLAYCSIDYVRQEAGTQLGSGLPHWQYQAASHTRAIRGMGLGSDVADNDFIGFSYRHVSVNPALQELRLWQSLSNFGGLDYYMMGRPERKEDTSAFDRVRKVFRYAAEHEALFSGLESEANVLLVRDSYMIPHPEERGWVRVLTELHLLFDEVLSAGLEKKDLSRYACIILPEKNRLSPGAAEKISAWVRSGGKLVASGQLPAMDCFGVRCERGRNDQVMGAMLRLPEAPRPLFMIGHTYWEREYEEETILYGRYLKPERFGPPELCYATEAPTDYPGAAKHPYGEGFGISIPWYPASCYYHEGYDNWFVFLRYLLLEICRLNPLASEEDLSPMVEVSLGRKEGLSVLHFINGSGHFGNSFFDPPVLSGQKLSLPWPYESASCKNLDEPENLQWECKEGRLTITIPHLRFHAGIVISAPEDPASDKH